MFPVVSKAGNLLQSRINELALCIAYPESVQKSGLSLGKSERKEQKVVSSSLRFSTKECGYPSLEATDVSFSVSTPVLLHGVTLYGGTDASYKYKVVLYQQADPPKALTEVEGSYSHNDYYGESFVDVKFKQPAKLEVREITYMYVCESITHYRMPHVCMWVKQWLGKLNYRVGLINLTYMYM